MPIQYKVDTFVPTIKGCGATDNGWTPERCDQYAKFLNGHATTGWKLHSSEYREVMSTPGCSSSKSAWLVCVFERTA